MRIFLLCLLVLVACNSKVKSLSNKTQFTDNEKKVLTFLWGNEQMLNEKYYSTFNNFYVTNLKKNKQELILKAIEHVCSNEIYQVSFNERFRETIFDFHEQYQHKFDVYDWLFYYNYLGNYHFEMSEYDKANYYYDKVNSLTPRDRKSLEIIVYSISDQAFCESASGHYFNALQLNYKTIPMFEELNDKNGLGIAAMNIGLINLFTKDYVQAKKYLNEAVQLFSEIKEFRNYFICLHNLLIVYEDSEDPEFYDKINSFYKEFEQVNVEDLTVEISMQTYYIKYLIHQKQFDLAESMLSKIKSKLHEIDSESSKIEYLISKAEYDIAKTGELKDEEELISMIEKIGKSENYQIKIALYEVLLNHEVAQENWKAAFDYGVKLTSNKDSLTNEVAQTLSQEAQDNYQKKKLKEEIENKDALISRKNDWIYGLIIIVFLSLFLFALFFFRRKQYNLRKDHVRSQKFARQLIVKIEEERSRISADLHDSVNHDLLNIKRELYQKNLPQFKLLENVINDIRNISRNIHPVLFQQIGFTASLKNLINTVEASHTIPIISEIQYAQSFDTFQELNLYRIIQECLSNALKYSQAHAIQIVITDSKNNFEMTIKDNGQGFDLKKTLATKNVFGLESIYNRAKILGCNCTIISSQKGTSITIKKTK